MTFCFTMMTKMSRPLTRQGYLRQAAMTLTSQRASQSIQQRSLTPARIVRHRQNAREAPKLKAQCVGLGGQKAVHPCRAGVVLARAYQEG